MSPAGVDDDESSDSTATNGDERSAATPASHDRDEADVAGGWSGSPAEADLPGDVETPAQDRPDRRTGVDADRGIGDAGTRSTGSEQSGWRTFAHDVVTSALAVLLVGGLLFAVSGVWPPMVAIESPSMTPNMKTGDLVFVMEEERFPGEGAHAGVVTARTGRTTAVDYRKFGREGDVIVYKPDGNGDRTPIIHRAMFWVEEGENWYAKADRQSVGRYSECGDSPSEALPNCPAPHAGFITKGDANGIYDQAQGLSEPVRPSWVVGTAEARVPVLGCVRLRNQGCAELVFGTTGLPVGAGA